MDSWSAPRVSGQSTTRSSGGTTSSSPSSSGGSGSPSGTGQDLAPAARVVVVAALRGVRQPLVWPRRSRRRVRAVRVEGRAARAAAVAAAAGLQAAAVAAAGDHLKDWRRRCRLGRGHDGVAVGPALLRRLVARSSPQFEATGAPGAGCSSRPLLRPHVPGRCPPPGRSASGFRRRRARRPHRRRSL